MRTGGAPGPVAALAGALAAARDPSSIAPDRAPTVEGMDERGAFVPDLVVT
ncbi:MAG TPA: hypothetical protein VFZ68_02555 [Acidimicrobiales bacterium]